MTFARRLTRLAVLGAVALLVLGAAEKYHTDFSSAELGKLPAELEGVGGGFKVVEFDKDKVLELPGDPLEICGLLFGPAGGAEVDVRARAWSALSGRRFPEFGVGTGDVAGYRLILVPAAKHLELRKGDEPVASVETAQPWRTGTWTWLRLRVSRKSEGRWTIEGKAWAADATEPSTWQLTHEATEPPQAGRASVWGIPFSGQPIRFDDLGVQPAVP